MVQRLSTPRLRLIRLTADALDAWVRKDARRLLEETGARFPEPVDAPPLFSEDLVRIRDGASANPVTAPWLFMSDDVPVGAGGVVPEPNGVWQVGYAMWPAHERRGFATEAVGALCTWAFSQGAEHVRATIPVGHVASERVVEKNGFVRDGFDVDPEAGKVTVFRLTRPVS